MDVLTVTLQIAGGTCPRCKSAIEEALHGLPGVVTTCVDLNHDAVEVTYLDRDNAPGTLDPIAYCGYALHQRLCGRRLHPRSPRT